MYLIALDTAIAVSLLDICKIFSRLKCFLQKMHNVMYFHNNKLFIGRVNLLYFYSKFYFVDTH